MEDPASNSTAEPNPEAGRHDAPAVPGQTFHEPPKDVWVIRPAWIGPIALTMTALVSAFTLSWWGLAAVPFIWLGSVSAQPNLNLADGCLSYLAGIAGIILLPLNAELGLAIFVGVTFGYVAGFIEKVIRMRLVPVEVFLGK